MDKIGFQCTGHKAALNPFVHGAFVDDVFTLQDVLVPN